MGGKGKQPARATGPRCRAATQFSRAPSIGVFGFVPVWARSIFSSSCVVVRWWPACVQAPRVGGTGARVQGRSRRPQADLGSSRTTPGQVTNQLYLTRRPVAFEEQFSGITPLPQNQNTVVSLDFPSVTSVVATRFFDKCYATAALGRTVVLVGGFRDRPANRRVRQALAQRAPGDSQDAMVLLTFPGRSFPAGAVLGWPESPD